MSSAGHSEPSAMMALILQLPGLHLRNVTSPGSNVCVHRFERCACGCGCVRVFVPF